MKIKELAQKLDNEIIPKRFQESYDNCGLIVGSGENDITGILTTLDVTGEVVLEAERLGCNLIIAHHPIIFFAIKSMVDSNSNQKTIMLAISKGISIYAAHTSLDNRFLGGINEALAENIGLTDVKPLKYFQLDNDSPYEDEVMGSGAIGVLAEPEFIVDFLYRLKKTLKLRGSVRYSNVAKNIPITKIALCSGAGLFMAQEAKRQGAELFITSDITYHGFFDEKDIVLADIGHYESEKHSPEVISKLLKVFGPSELNPERIFISEVNTNPILTTL